MRLIALLLLVPLVALANIRPDPIATPGARNPAVTQETIDMTICVPGYAKRIRPPSSVTNQIKRRELAAGPYRSPLPMSAFELDHLVPLSLGGAPADERNLWLQSWAHPYGAHEKDRLEVWLHHMVCRREWPLAQAQDAIASDWVAAYRRQFDQPD